MSFFTKIELRRLYRRFRYPRIERFYTILIKAGYKADISILEKIKKFYYYY
jgi:hypothetical protein